MCLLFGQCFLSVSSFILQLLFLSVGFVSVLHYGVLHKHCTPRLFIDAMECDASVHLPGLLSSGLPRCFSHDSLEK